MWYLIGLAWLILAICNHDNSHIYTIFALLSIIVAELRNIVKLLKNGMKVTLNDKEEK